MHSPMYHLKTGQIPISLSLTHTHTSVLLCVCVCEETDSQWCAQGIVNQIMILLILDKVFFILIP